MVRFAIFVDGSNLAGSLQNMGVRIDDYQAFFNYVFSQTVMEWKRSFLGASQLPICQLRRVYWYEIGSMDEWELNDYKARKHLEDRFNADRDVKRMYMALAGQSEKKNTKESQYECALRIWFEEIEQWYAEKKRLLSGIQRFHHGVRNSTDFIDIIECGHWKVDLLRKGLTEKMLDTALAVDMITKLDNYDVAVLLSGDQDCIPGIEHLKAQNKTVATVQFMSGYSQANRNRQFAGKLNLVCDFVANLSEMDILGSNIGSKL